MISSFQRFSTTRVRAVLIAMAVAGGALVLPGIAAASPAPLSEFSPYVPPQHYTVGNCTVAVGPLWDGSVGWASVGGMTVTCSRNQASLVAEVQEQYSPSGKAGTWYYVGSIGTASGANINGWNGFIHGSGVCGAGYWSTRFWLYTPSTGWQTAASNAAYTTTPAGCVNGSPAAN